MGATQRKLLGFLAFDFNLNSLQLQLLPLAINEIRLTVGTQLLFVDIAVIVKGCGHGPGHVVTLAKDDARHAGVRAANQVDFLAFVYEGELHELPEGRDLCAQVGVAAEDGLAGRRVVAVDDPVVARC